MTLTRREPLSAHRIWRSILASMFFVIVTSSGVSLAQPEKETKRVPPSAAKTAVEATRGSQSIDAAQEAAATAFARTHHPELTQLLKRLKQANGPSYTTAIRDLSLESERLERLKQRDPVRYELELEVWKANSRIQLITARLSMESDDSEMRTELLQLLRTRNSLRLELLQQDRDRLTNRLTKVESDLKLLEVDADGVAEAELTRLLKRARARETLPRGAQPRTAPARAVPADRGREPSAKQPAAATDGPVSGAASPTNKPDRK